MIKDIFAPVLEIGYEILDTIFEFEDQRGINYSNGKYFLYQL